MKSSISASISASHMALAAWSTSNIMARWKCATALAAASTRSSRTRAPQRMMSGASGRSVPAAAGRYGGERN
jgi:hypothetical protein